LTEAVAELAAVAFLLIIVFSNVIGIILGFVIESDFNVPIRSNIFLLLLLFVFSVTLSFLVSILKFSNLKPPVVRDLLVLLLLRKNELVRFEIVFVFVSLLVESFLRRPLYSNAAVGSFLFVIVVAVVLFIS
jgi:hypothetical protein